MKQALGSSGDVYVEYRPFVSRSTFRKGTSQYAGQVKLLFNL